MASDGANHLAEAPDERELLIDKEEKVDMIEREPIKTNGRLLAKFISFITSSTKQTPTSSPTTKQHHQQDWLYYLKSDDGLRTSVYNYLEDDLEPSNINHSCCTSSTSNHHHHQKKSHNNNSNSNISGILKRRKCRPILTLLLFILLLVASFPIICKLLVLIQNQKILSERYQAAWNNGRGADDYAAAATAATLSSVEQEAYKAGKESRWLVSQPKCHIPSIDPWHESILSYVKIKPKLNCPQILKNNGTDQQPSLTYVKSNRLFLTKKAIELGVLPKRHCCYRVIERSEENDDDLSYNQTCHSINKNALRIPFSVIKVECAIYNYVNVHSFIVANLEEEAALARTAARKLQLDKHYNLVLVGVDTISRLNGQRQLNRTLTLLRDQYKSIEYLGYNKVGENTFPNLIPLLSGLKPEQLTETQCWLATNYSQESEKGDDYLDNCKYLWNYYQELGYITYFSEDWPKASTFNYLKQGFKREPTAFYGRPFTIARDDLLLPTVKMGCASCLIDRPLAGVDVANLKSFIEEYQQRPYFAFQWINCPQHDDLNGASQIDDILEQFFKDIHKITQDNRTFVMFFSDHGYRWNNFVSTRVGHYEASLPLLHIAAPKQFIESHPDLYENMKQHRSALLTPFDMFKTLVDIRNLGRKESKDLRPQSQHHHRTIREAPPVAGKAVNSVNTAIDQPTLLSTTSSPSTSTTTFKQLQPLDGLSYKQNFKVLSLLKRHKPYELDRSCIEAGIPDNYCVCHEFASTSTNTTDVLGAAYYLVYIHLYTRIKDHTKLCHSLDLEAIHQADLFNFKHMKATKKTTTSRRRRRLVKRADDDDDDPDADSKLSLVTTPRPIEPTTDEVVINESHYLPNREYNIRLSTKPGGGLFQEVVRFYGEDMKQCQLAIDEARETIEEPAANSSDKHDSVMRMNEVCKFSVQSESISRLNLYKDQSKCVKRNIELKKICYCRDL